MTEKIAIITDSMCDLPRDIAKRFCIKVIPAKIIFPEKAYSDRVDIEPDDVYSRMPDEIPTTSMPSPGDVRRVFDEVKAEGFTHALAIHISSGLSGTSSVVESVSREINNLHIKVIDSKTLTMGTGWLVLEAAQNIAAGHSFEKIIDNIHKLKEKSKVYYILETLEYLRRGGRIGQVAAVIGEFLHLKPVISVNLEGTYFTYCKAKGRKKSIEKLVQIVENTVKEHEIKLAVLHGGAQQECQKLVERLQKLPNIKEIMSSDISPALGVHTGPGLLGIALLES